MKGKIVEIKISEKKGEPKISIDEGELEVDFGLKGDAHGGSWDRQVSLFGLESINKMKKIGVKGLCTSKFVENITTEGVNPLSLSVGTQLYINDSVLEVTQIGKECHKKCAIYHQTGGCVMTTEGVFAKVIKGGKIRLGDDIMFEII